MNTCSLILYGMVDILFEWCGFIMAHGLRHKEGIEAVIVTYGSMSLDVIKTLVVIGGFVCTYIISSGISDYTKRHLLHLVTIIQWLILVPAVLLAIYIEYVLFKDPHDIIDLRTEAMIMFFVYAVLKFVTFFGFCQFLKNVIHDAPKVEGFFGHFGGLRYFPVNLYPGPQEGYQIPAYPLTYNLQSHYEHLPINCM
eukprot:TRINITY_DN2480_c0_g2_i3.p3 TRINITY_DN2480_c0_g2~~TRINITY_DN2480_c0_g2_i3.p3  ORF type:complete len:196 (-),score=3.96 TRINITY_DN2480_c0_g2_i3:806-1393(-)